MSLAGSIDQRERELNIEEKFSLFLDFLNDHVWSRKQKIGEHDIVYLLSQHHGDEFFLLRSQGAAEGGRGIGQHRKRG